MFPLVPVLLFVLAGPSLRPNGVGGLRQALGLPGPKDKQSKVTREAPLPPPRHRQASSSFPTVGAGAPALGAFLVPCKGS